MQNALGDADKNLLASVPIPTLLKSKPFLLLQSRLRVFLHQNMLKVLFHDLNVELFIQKAYEILAEVM